MSPVKDRLGDLLNLQKNNNQPKEDAQHEQNGLEIQQVFDTVEVIRQDFDAMRGNTNRMVDLLDKYRLYPTKELQAQLHSILDASTTKNYTVSNKLKQFEKVVSKASSNGNNDRIKKLQYASLKQEFQDLLHQNNEVIETYRDTLKSQIKATAKVVRPTQSEDELEELLHDNQPIQVFIGNILEDTNVARQQLQDIEGRHKELLFIETQIQDVGQLFKIIAVQVEQQQESIDRVEYHCQTATDLIEQGAVDLSKGSRKKRKCLKCKIYLGIAFTILVICVIASLFI